MKELQQFMSDYLVEDNRTLIRARAQTKYLKTHYPKILDRIYQTTEFLNQSSKLPERLYCIFYTYTSVPKCSCGKILRFRNFRIGYGIFCSNTCTDNIKNLQNLNKEAALNRYGVESFVKSKEVRDKINKTLLDKYGTTVISSISGVRKKITNTNQLRYGGNAPASDPNIAAKISDTQLNFSLEKKQLIRDKFKETSIERYGEDNPVKNLNIANKISKSWKSKTEGEVQGIVSKREETCIERYGVTNPIKSEEVKQKLRDNFLNKNKEQLKKEKDLYSRTCMKRYGVPNPNQRHLNPKLVFFRKNEPKYRKWLHNMHIINKNTLQEISTFLGIDSTIVGKDMKRFNIPIIQYFNRSVGERQLYSFIKSLDNNLVIDRNKKNIIGKELDLYLPDKNLALEFNGLYWHSYCQIPTTTEKNRHKEKTKRCRLLGIKLFHIFENEWTSLTKRKVWKSIIKNTLVGSSNKIYARKCEIKLITSKEVRKFLNQNHLQGFCTGSLYYGLVYRGELVSCMTFTKKSNVEYELTRFCSKLDTQVIGGASKLLKYFESNNSSCKSIVTFADLRYSYGYLYHKLGFKFNKNLPIKHYYTDKNDILHPRRYQKKYLKTRFGSKYDPKITEIDNVLKNTNLRVLWDAGKVKFIKNLGV